MKYVKEGAVKRGLQAAANAMPAPAVAAQQSLPSDGEVGRVCAKLNAAADFPIPGDEISAARMTEVYRQAAASPKRLNWRRNAPAPNAQRRSGTSWPSGRLP